MNVLQIKALNKSYGKKAFSLQDISLQAEHGELLALIGESGSGKTTLLRLIAGFEKADSGEIRIAGQIVIAKGIALPPEKRKIGMVFQNYALFPHLNLFENVSYGLHKMNTEQKKQRVREVMELVNLSGFEQRYPHELSGGQQQRVALARAIAPEPGLLLLDEPFSNLDAMLKDQVREEVRQILKKTGTTAIFVTHDIKDALSTADRIAILKNGKVQQIGTPEELYEKPANAYVARFFGKVNLLQATTTEEGYLTSAGFIPAKDQLPGRTGILALRPEHIRLCEAEETKLHAKLKKIIYLGDQQELSLEIKKANESLELLMTVSNEIKLQVGQEIYFEVNAQNVCWLNGE